METGLSSPWFSMWIRPRKTIRKIINTDPFQHITLLAAIAGIGITLSRASQNSLGDGDSLAQILILAIPVGMIGGILSLYMRGALLEWTGGWIGGRAQSHEIRAALAWSGIIDIWLMLLWIPDLLIFGKELFTTQTPQIDASTPLTVLFWLSFTIQTIGVIWAVVVSLKCLGEVQRFSTWKALGNSALPVLVVLLPILGIAGLITLCT